MGVITDWFSAASPEAAVAAVEEGRWSDTRWEERHGAPDPLVDLPPFTAAVTGVPQRDLGLDPAPSIVGEVDEAIVLAVPEVLVAALAAADDERLRAMAVEVDAIALDVGGEPEDV